MTGVLRRAQDERAGQPHPRIKYGAGSNPLPSRERGCPSTGSGRTARWAQRDCRVAALLAMTGVLRRAQDERAGHPHPRIKYPLPSRERGCPSTGSGRTGGSPSPQPVSHQGMTGMSFDGLRTNGRVTLTPTSHQGRGDVFDGLTRTGDRWGRTGSGRTGAVGHEIAASQGFIR